MIFNRLMTDDDPLFCKAMDLYRASFPLHEQRKAESQRQALNHVDYHFDLIYDATHFIGIMLYWETDHFIYVEHFAIDPHVRNGGFGSKALHQLAKKDKTIILEIDPPIDDIAIRRKGFYERVGFQANNYQHIHPPYSEQTPGHALVVMSYPALLNPAEYNQFNTYLQRVVMGKIV